MLMGTEVDTVLLDNWPLLLLIAGCSVHCITMCALTHVQCNLMQCSMQCVMHCIPLSCAVPFAVQ